MRAAHLAALAALAIGASGCFSSWLVTQAAGGQRVLDERARAEVVPLPGLVERLTVRIPLGPAEASGMRIAGDASGTTVTQTPPAAAPAPLALRCTTTQEGRDAHHIAAYRYGRQWKRAAAVMFLIEAGVAAFWWFGSRRDDLPPGERDTLRVLAGVAGVHALGTGALFFVPRKEIIRREERPVTTELRTDCPDGLALLVGPDAFPIDARGRIGELGELALDTWMRTPQPPGSLAIEFEGRVTDLRVGQATQCAWQQRAAGAPATCSQGLGAATDLTAVFEVPVGALTSVPADAP